MQEIFSGQATLAELLMSAIFGSLLAFLGKWILAVLRHKSAVMVANQQYGNDRIEILLKSSEEYREEMRKDMAKMASDMKKMKDDHEKEMLVFREKYEITVNEMQEQIKSLSEEIEQYRQENGALHLLLKTQGIEVPNWIRKDKDGA